MKVRFVSYDILVIAAHADDVETHTWPSQAELWLRCLRASYGETTIAASDGIDSNTQGD